MADIENNANVVDELVVDDGTRRIPIKNQVGDEVGVFYFSPTDTGILTRIKDAQERFEYVVAPLKEANITNTGEGEDEFSDELLVEAERRLYELCDYIFGGNLSEAFFGKVKPFSPVNGNFYCENALNVVIQYINKQFGAEAQRINARVDKYTHGIRTGKHKDGKK